MHTLSTSALLGVGGSLVGIGIGQAALYLWYRWYSRRVDAEITRLKCR